MNLFPGDAQIIMLLHEFRFLTTGQLAELTGRDPQLIRRAIRKRLRPGKFVVNFERRPTEEAACTLGEQGLAFVAYELGCNVEDLPFPRKVTTTRSFFFRHTLAISAVRVIFALAAAADESPIVVDRSIAEWDTTVPTRSGAKKDARFILAERLVGGDGKTYTHRPDCLLLCYPKATGRDQLVAVYVELDRNTESVARRIAAKYEGYWLQFRRRRYAEAFGALAMRVVFILDDVTGRTRIRSMQEALRAFAMRTGDPVGGESFRRCFRFARMSDLDRLTLLTKPVFFDADDRARLFFQASQSPIAEDRAEAVQ